MTRKWDAESAYYDGVNVAMDLYEDGTLESAAAYAEIKQLRADLAAARAALEAVEWVEGTDGFAGKFEWCPWCKYDKLIGHAPDCPRQVALGLAKKTEETK